MNSLFFSYNMNIDRAYIIRIKGNKKSEEKAKRCADTCENVGMPYSFWDAYNGIEEKIVPPDHHNDLMKMLKITDHYLTRGEVACALSHISLWAKCAAEDKPIIILEHDAIMLEACFKHAVYNSIGYLGGHEQAMEGWSVLPTPPHASEGPNYHFICRAHAYSIDPAVAKNLLSYVLRQGICAPLDIIIRADIFSIHQTGLYAYDEKDQTKTISEQETTILGRPKVGRTTIRNDRLET